MGEDMIQSLLLTYRLWKRKHVRKAESRRAKDAYWAHRVENLQRCRERMRE